MIKYVPVQLIQCCLTIRGYNYLRTFIFLKNYSNTGTLKLKTVKRKKFSDLLEISLRTLNRHIEILVKEKWISIDMEETIFLRSWKYIEKHMELKFRAKVEFKSNYIKKEQYLGYFMGAVMSYQCKLKMVNKWIERKKERSRQPIDKRHPLSISYLSNLLKIPKSTALSYKQEAIKYGYIFRFANVERTMLDVRNIDVSIMRESFPENGFPRIIKGKLCLVHPDSFISGLYFKTFR